MKKLFFCFTIMMLTSLPEILAQATGTDCNGQVVWCERNKRYPYNSCENGNFTVRCYGYDDIPLPPNTVRTFIPICFDQAAFISAIGAPFDYIINGKDIYSPTKALDDIKAVIDEWNCICGYPANSGGACCFKIVFTDNLLDFSSMDIVDNRAGEAQYRRGSCFIDCSDPLTKIVLNNTGGFIQADPVNNPGKDVRGFYNGDVMPNMGVGNYAIYNLKDVVQHEVGHLLGLPHFHTGNCDGAGVMSKDPSANQPRLGLSADDRCRFAYLYCMFVVPVEEEEKTNKYQGTLDVAPSPVISGLIVKYNVPKSSEVTIKIIDVNGKTIKTLKSANETVGDKEEVYELSSLLNGTYFIVVKIGEQELSRKVIKEVR